VSKQKRKKIKEKGFNREVGRRTTLEGNEPDPMESGPEIHKSWSTRKKERRGGDNLVCLNQIRRRQDDYRKGERIRKSCRGIRKGESAKFSLGGSKRPSKFTGEVEDYRAYATLESSEGRVESEKKSGLGI